MYEAVLTFTFVPASWFTIKPELSASTLSSVVTSAAVVLRLRCGSLPATIPRALSQTYQSPVLSVRLIRINLAPEVNPQSIVWLVPLPV
jgi:hypothetical protein